MTIYLFVNHFSLYSVHSSSPPPPPPLIIFLNNCLVIDLSNILSYPDHTGQLTIFTKQC